MASQGPAAPSRCGVIYSTFGVAWALFQDIIILLSTRGLAADSFKLLLVNARCDCLSFDSQSTRSLGSIGVTHTYPLGACVCIDAVFIFGL